MEAEELTREEARVLGTLLEKSMATPDYYPMTLSALRMACNQKTSREPISDYNEETVATALAGLKRKCYGTFIPYGSKTGNFKYGHFLEDVRFGLRKMDMAVLAVLLLRGAQTVNEIRTRASSLHPLASLEETEAVLHKLSQGAKPVVERLEKRPGWKEQRWRHRFFDWGTEEDAPLNTGDTRITQDTNSVKLDAFEDMKAELQTHRGEIAALRQEIEILRADIDKMRTDLYGAQ